MEGWYDAEDFTPGIICEVELSNGEKMRASYVCGSWETLDGAAIYPIRFRPLTIVVNVGLYKAPFDIE